MNPPNLTLTLNRILLEEDALPEFKEGEIIMPSNWEPRFVRGKVVAAGPGQIMGNGAVRTNIVSVGDVVWFEKYGAQEFPYNGKKYLLTRDDSVSVIEPKT